MTDIYSIILLLLIVINICIYNILEGYCCNHSLVHAKKTNDCEKAIECQQH